MAKTWYAFNGGDALSAMNYIRNDGVVKICLCGTDIGAIYAQDGGQHPIHPLSTNIQAYIKAALSTGQIQPKKPYSARKYVYLMG